MAAISMWRGHKIQEINEQWVFVDTGEPVADSDRPCGYCHKYRTSEGHDACLGTLPGVQNACCGHGQIDDAYVQMPSGTITQGREAKIAAAQAAEEE